MRKFIFILFVACLYLPFISLAQAGTCNQTCQTVTCRTPLCYPCCCYSSCFCPHYYIKPALTYSRREQDFAERRPWGEAISIGFIEPWTSYLSWGIEGGWGYYGRDTSKTFTSQSILTDIDNSTTGSQTQLRSNNIITTERTVRYNAFDIAALLYAQWCRLSVFGKAGFANVQRYTTGNNPVPLGEITDITVVGPVTTTTTTSPIVGLQPVRSRVSDTVPLLGFGLDYLFTRNIAGGIEFIHIAGSTALDPMNSLQLYIRLTT